jgi:Protein of unknown function (DUF3987)
MTVKFEYGYSAWNVSVSADAANVIFLKPKRKRKPRPADAPPRKRRKRSTTETPAANSGRNAEGKYYVFESLHAAAEYSWEHPDLNYYLGRGRSAPPDFPVDVLPEFWAKWCMAHHKARYTPIDYTACTLLAATAGVILNRRWAQATPEWSEPTILWLANLGDPVDGKSPGMRPVKKLLETIEADAVFFKQPEVEEYKEKLESSKKARKKWEDACGVAKAIGNEPPPMPPEAATPPEVIMPRITVSDATTEAIIKLLTAHPLGCLQYRDELQGWLGGMNQYKSGVGGDKQFWIEAYEGGRYNVDRVKNAKPMTIPNLSVGVIGGIQPDVLSVLLKGANDGFVSRFLWAWPNRVPGFSIVAEPVDSRMQIKALDRIFKLTAGHSMVEVPYTDDAKEIFEAFVRRNKESDDVAAGRMKGAIGKGASHVVRISMVLSLLDWSCQPNHPEPKPGVRTDPKFIESKYVADAIRLVETYFYPMAERAFQESAMSPLDVRARRLLEWLRKAGNPQFNAKQVRLAIGGDLRDAKDMDAVLDVLVLAHLIKPSATRKGNTHGRLAKNFEVNPKVWPTAATCQATAA